MCHTSNSSIWIWIVSQLRRLSSDISCLYWNVTVQLILFFLSRNGIYIPSPCPPSLLTYRSAGSLDYNAPSFADRFRFLDRLYRCKSKSAQERLSKKFNRRKDRYPILLIPFLLDQIGSWRLRNDLRHTNFRLSSHANSFFARRWNSGFPAESFATDPTVIWYNDKIAFLSLKYIRKCCISPSLMFLKSLEGKI